MDGTFGNRHDKLYFLCLAAKFDIRLMTCGLKSIVEKFRFVQGLLYFMSFFSLGNLKIK